MAFNARETFKDDIENLDKVNGSRIVPDGAPDIYNAVTSYLDKISQQIEENKDNPDKLKKLQSLALRITETYFANTGENGGNNDIANLSEYMQSKLKTILGENSTVKSKYPELTAKIKEITTPEPEKEPQIISLEANAEAHAQYQALTGNEARRQFVLDEFGRGSFSDPSHINFFLEQYGKGEINVGSANTPKLEALLNGINGYAGVEEHFDTIVKDTFTSNLTWTQYETDYQGHVIQGTGKLRLNDLGLAEALDKIDKAQGKDDFSQLLLDAQKEAISWQYDGVSLGKDETTGKDTITRLKEASEKLEAKGLFDKLNIKRYLNKRKVDKALKKIDKLVPHDISEGWNVGSYKGSRSEKLDGAIAALDIRIAQEERLASMRWMSTNFFNKLGQKALLTFGVNKEKGDKPYAYGSKQHLINNMLKHSSAKDIDAYLAKLQTQLDALTPSPDADGTKLQNRGDEAKKKLLEEIKRQCEAHKKTLDAGKKEELKNLDTTNPLRSNEEAKKFKTNLEAHVAKLRENTAESLQKDPQYMAYVKLHGEKAAKEKFNVEKMITTDKVMDEILKAQGYSAEEIKEIKQKLGMNKEAEETKESKEEKTDEQTEEREAPETKKEVHLDSSAREDSKPVEGYEATNGAKLNVSEDGSRYDFITTNEDGSSREPTPEEIEKMVSALPKTLEDSFSADTQEAILKEFEKQGIAIDDMDKTLKQINDRREKEEAKKQAEEERKRSEDEHTVDPKKNTETHTETEREATSSTTEPKNSPEKEQMSMAKVMESIANNPENAEKKIQLLAEINKADLRVQGSENGNSTYAQMLNNISETFGKDSDEAKFLRSMVTNKSMEQELETAGFSKEETAEYASFIKENATSGKEDIKANTQQRLENISQVTDLAGRLKGKTDKEIEDALKEAKLPAYAKQGVSNLIKLENSDLKPEEKGRLRGQILGRIIEGKAQSKTVTRNVQQRSINPRMVTESSRDK